MKNDGPGAATITLDPRTEELLREIAADPNSSLLRSSRRELDDALTRSDYRGITTRVGLSAAERELLRTSRAELAYWLNVICFRRLTEDKETRHYCTRLTDGDREYIPPSNEDLRAGARSALQAATALGVDDLGAAELLLLAASPSPEAPHPILPSVRTLAAASLRLSPTFQARHYAIQALVRPGPRSGIDRLSDIHRTLSQGRIQGSYALSLQAQVSWSAGQPRRALSLYLSASNGVPSFGEYRVRALLMALASQSRDVAKRLVREIESLGLGEPVMRIVSASVHAYAGKAPAEVSGLTRLILQFAGPNVRGIIHDLATT